MPALTAAEDLKKNSDFSLSLRLMDFSFQSRTLLSDGINHKIPHFKSMISWRTTAHFISYQEIEQISHISWIPESNDISENSFEPKMRFPLYRLQLV